MKVDGGRLRDGGKEGRAMVRTLASLRDKVSLLLLRGAADALWWRDEGLNSCLGSRYCWWRQGARMWQVKVIREWWRHDSLHLGFEQVFGAVVVGSHVEWRNSYSGSSLKRALQHDNGGGGVCVVVVRGSGGDGG
ncbi:hypothetical protein LR48_Vigan10g136000 [Vigna angularis]|uniref:Uncharacterized protein n=1 Tax=Phaseolus angularis TaxID=3914 RepID=A0A0L9VKH7_PHAAN|nr:hypothetical protein LR48_Vigan10g136000 [Vigna angularis]